MKILNNRYVFDFAVKEDNEQILKILEETDFTGKINILYTRRPNAIDSFMLEGEEVLLITCKDKTNNKLVGFGACAINTFFINQKEVKVGYLFGLRSAKEYLKKINFLHYAYDYLYDLVKNKNIEFFYTTILEENLIARKLLEKKRKYMPYYEYLSDYIVYSIKTNLKEIKSNYYLQRCSLKNKYELIEFLNNNGKKMNFFPVINTDIINKLDIENFYFLKNEKDEILCAGMIWNQKKYKQHIIKNYSGIFKYVKHLRYLMPLFGYPILPKENTVLNFFTLSFFCIKNNDSSLFKIFISKLSKLYNNYSFFLIGLSEENPLNETFNNITKITYKSRIYLVDWDKKGNLKNNFNGKFPIYLECGRL